MNKIFKTLMHVLFIFTWAILFSSCSSCGASSDPNNTKLTSIVLSEGTITPTFSNDVTNYTAYIPLLTREVTTTITAQDKYATIKLNSVALRSGRKSEPISVYLGNNTLTIEVTSANKGHKQIYTVTVVRQIPELTVGMPLIADDAQGSGEKQSLSIYEDTLANGHPYKQNGSYNSAGAVYIYSKVSGSWVLETKLSSPVPADNEWFGYSVSLAQDTIAVGAPNNDMSTQAGTVYIFKKSGGVWNYSQTITPPTPTSGGQFGYKTIISGDHMVISEPGATSVTSPETRAGVIHIYRLESGAWTPEQTVDANIEARQGDGLGKGLDFNGSYIAAGAPNGESGLRSGAVHAFYNDGTTWVWAGGGVYDPVDNPANMFGENISIYSSSSVVVGVPLESTTATESGGVYLCTTIGCTKTPIKPPSPETNEHFGASVWIYDDIIIAGAPGKNGGQGAIYAIGLDSVNSWSLLSSSTVPNGVQAGEGFGSAVMGTSTGSLFIGSSSRDSSSLTDIGACYVMEQTY